MQNALSSPPVISRLVNEASTKWTLVVNGDDLLKAFLTHVGVATRLNLNQGSLMEAHNI